MTRKIVHVDMDAFFASIEERDNPELKNKPLIIGADPKGGKGRGVVSTANYEARKFGVHSALPISRAYQLCPQGIFMPPDMRRYSVESRKIMEILSSFSPAVEQVSVDEAFLDCTGTRELFGSSRELGQKIKQAIKDKTGLTASVGIAVTKSIAKIASDFDKPDGLTIIEPGREKEFLRGLPIKKIWGVGKKTEAQLSRLGIFQVSQLIDMGQKELEAKFGKFGTHIWEMANGIDDRSVVSNLEGGHERKSISEERTFEEDTDDIERVKILLLKLADDISNQMRKEEIAGKTINLKIRLTGFETFTRSLTIDSYVNDPDTISQVGLQLFDNFDRRQKKIRLIGLGVSNLLHEKDVVTQRGLFDNSNDDEKKKKIYNALDALKDKYGKKIVGRAVFLDDTNKDVIKKK